MDEKKIDDLRRFFNEQGWVELAFLFGSQAKGRAHSESDFDLAVWPAEKSPENATDKIWLQLEKLLNHSVDLVSLPDASPTVAWEAFKGIPLKIKDERFYLNKMLEVSDAAEDISNFIIDVFKAREAKETHDI